MKYHRLDDMVKGWFVGEFTPAALRCGTCEVAVKRYPAGAVESKHHHKIATELTVIISGSVRMLGKTWHTGDILTIEPNEATSFEALTDATTVVVKLPSVANDKYPDVLKLGEE